MDEVRERMQLFRRRLEELQDALKLSIADTRGHHELVSPMWQDSMRREYDAAWTPLEQKMEEYVARIGPSQVETMITKLRHLGRYLDGH